MGNTQGSKHTHGENSRKGIHTEDIDVTKLKQTFSVLQKQDKTEDKDEVTEENIRDLCGVSKPYGSMLYVYLNKDPDEEDFSASPIEPSLPLEKFVSNGKTLLHTNSASNQIKVYSKVCCKGKSSCDKKDVLDMLQICYVLAFHCAGVDFENVAELKFDKMIKSMFGSDDEVTINHLQSWLSRHCDGAFHGVHSYTCSLLTRDASITQEISATPPPALLSKLKDSKHLLNEPVLWALSATLPHTYFPQGAPKSATTTSEPLGNIMAPSGWHLLYDSNHHGLSLNRFIHHVISYDGPNLMLFSFHGNLFCLAVDCGWRDGTERWGGHNCCLVQMEPQYKVMMSGGNMVYLNTQNRNVPKGIQVGKEVKTLILQMNEEMTKISLFGNQQDLDRIEMWGCGGSKARKAQQDQKKWEGKEAEKAKQRKLKPDDWEDNPDRQLLDMGGVKTSHAER